MLRIIIYGAGKRAKNQLKYWKGYFEIVGLVDTDESKWGQCIEQFEVQSPSLIKKISYDYILISVEGEMFSEIEKYLNDEFRISKSRIIDSMTAIKLAMKEKRGQVKRKKEKTRVYDCFMFFNELELLKIRLETLSPYVDYFVLVEMDKNFKGEKKPLYYRDNIKLFEEYKEKIIYITPDDSPNMQVEIGVIDWTLEIYQREAMLSGLLNCNPDDLIIVSDLDEFPNPNKIKEALDKNSNLAKLLDEEAVVMEQKLYYYYFNNLCNRKWYGSFFCKWKNMLSPQWLREYRARLNSEKDGGWHFSYVGGLERIKEKNVSISDGKEYDEQIIIKALNTGELMDSNWGEKTIVISLEDHDFPNIEKLKKEYRNLFIDKKGK